MDKNAMLDELLFHFTRGNKAQFANMLGVKPQTINTWQKRQTFDAELIFAKCDDVSGDWLLSGEGPMLQSTRKEQQALSDPERKLLDLCKSLVGVCEQKDLLMGELVAEVKKIELR